MVRKKTDEALIDILSDGTHSHNLQKPLWSPGLSLILLTQPQRIPDVINLNSRSLLYLLSLLRLTPFSMVPILCLLFPRELVEVEHFLRTLAAEFSTWAQQAKDVQKTHFLIIYGF